MAIAHLVHGFVCVGKTTYAKKLSERQLAIRFSLDEWIINFYGQDLSADRFKVYEHHVSELIWNFAAYALRAEQDVILDFGFWSRSSRDQARQKVEAIGANAVLHCVTCSDETARRRLVKRNNQRPPDALEIDEAAIALSRERFEPLEDDEPHQLIVTDA